MNAIPERFTSDELNEVPEACTTCQTLTDESRRWVACPMVAGQLICFGCCLDLQSLARDPEFESDPFRDLFEGLEGQTGTAVEHLRRICMEHQQEIIATQLVTASRDQQDALLALAAQIAEVGRKLE